MGKTIKLCLVGEMRSGKDAIGDYLVSSYGFKRYAFGDALKEDFHKRYPEIPSNPKPRVGYQSHGQLMRELVNEDIWLDRCLAKVRDEGCRAVVITDCRQPNEFLRCRSEGYVIIRVTAPEALRIDRAIKSGDTFNLRDLTHDTESHARSFDVDYEIVNDGTLAELYAKVDEVIRNVSA